MTRKQLEQAIRFISMFDDKRVDIAKVNETFGVKLTDSTTREEALTAFIEANGVKIGGMQRLGEINEGGWCFFRMELCLVRRITENGIEISNGYISTYCGHYAKEECFPLSLSIKVISASFKHYANKLHEIKHVNLNYPDIMRYIEQEYRTQCENYLAGRAVTYDGIKQFFDEIIEQTRVLSKEFVNGIKIIRPWINN